MVISTEKKLPNCETLQNGDAEKGWWYFHEDTLFHPSKDLLTDT